MARLLEKEPEARPGSAAEAWEALEEIVLGTLGPRWRRDAQLPTSRLRARAAGARPNERAGRVERGGLDRGPPGSAAPRHGAASIHPGAGARPRRPRKRPAWLIAIALMVVGWAVAVLLMTALSGAGRAPSPAAPRTSQLPGASEQPAAPAVRAATATATPARDRGVGDSRSDDPSDDEPDGEEP